MIRMTGAEITIRLLERQGIHTIAGIPGGAVYFAGNLRWHDSRKCSPDCFRSHGPT